MSKSRCRQPLRTFARSGDGIPYGAPHTASASAGISASTNVVSSDRSRSGDADATWSCRKRAGSILGFCGHRVVPPRADLAGLSKDHAVAVLHPDATPINGPVGTPLCWTQLPIVAQLVIHLCGRKVLIQAASKPGDQHAELGWTLGPSKPRLAERSAHGQLLRHQPDKGLEQQRNGQWR